jgi:uncharacterized phiE125 gp8 family phage protein
MAYSYLREKTAPLVEPISLAEMKAHLRITSSAEDTLITSLIRAARQYCEGVQGLSYVTRVMEMAFDDGFPEIIYPLYPPLVTVSSITYVDTAGDTQTLDPSYYTVDTHSSPPRVFEAYNKTWPSGVRGVENTVKVTYICGSRSSFTASAASDVLTIFSGAFSDTDKVRVLTSGGVLPTGLSADTDYYVISAAGATCKLSATEGGAAIDLTTAGTSPNYIYPAGKDLPFATLAAIKLLVGHLFENREATVEANLKTIPLGITHLINLNRVNW